MVDLDGEDDRLRKQPGEFGEPFRILDATRGDHGVPGTRREHVPNLIRLDHVAPNHDLTGSLEQDVSHRCRVRSAAGRGIQIRQVQMTEAAADEFASDADRIRFAPGAVDECRRRRTAALRAGAPT